MKKERKIRVLKYMSDMYKKMRDLVLDTDGHMFYFVDFEMKYLIELVEKDVSEGKDEKMTEELTCEEYKQLHSELQKLIQELRYFAEGDKKLIRLKEISRRLKALDKLTTLEAKNKLFDIREHLNQTQDIIEEF